MPGKIAHPRSKISGNEGGFKKFRIEELFEVYSPKKRFNANEIKLGEGHRYIARGSENNGIKGYTRQDPKYLSKANTISFGQDTATIYYQSQPYFTGDKIKVMEPKDFSLEQSSASYLIASMRKSFSLFSWGSSSFNEKILKNVSVSLPTTRNGNIDFSYMEKYIEELQQQQRNKIETFLKNIGLDNCELTKKEKDCINGKNTVFEKITIGDLFDIHPTKAYKATNKNLFHVDGKIPVVANSSVDNGIGGWTKLNATETGNKIVFSDTTTSDSIFYQPNNFVGYPHVQGLYPYPNKWNENSLLYFVSCFRKSAFGRFNYGLKFTRVIAKQMNVILPIKPNGEIDYDFMETFISAQKKLVAQKVVRWLEQQNINDNILKIEKNTPKQVLPMAADQKKKYKRGENFPLPV